MTLLYPQFAQKPQEQLLASRNWLRSTAQQTAVIRLRFTGKMPVSVKLLYCEAINRPVGQCDFAVSIQKMHHSTCLLALISQQVFAARRSEDHQ